METKGIIIKSTGQTAIVKLNDGSIAECKVKNSYRLKNTRTTNPLAVGDRVLVDIQNETDTSWVIQIEERKNYIIRKATNLSKESHVLAANVDLAAIVITIIMPDTALEFIDRFLVTAEAYRIQPILIFNKTDIYKEKELETLQQCKNIYQSVPYSCFEVSCVNNTGIEEVKKALKGKITVITGNSGVGKSTLINALSPLLHLKTGDLSTATKLGKHTTTFAEMFEIDENSYVIDSPGIRGFGLIDIQKEELYHFFPEIFKHSQNCKFHNCSHTHEPGCAVCSEVKKGSIALSRYQNYLNLLLNEEKKYRY